MTTFLRRAGTGRLADGSDVTWTVADGTRGRRWRAVATVDGAIAHALLLEVDLAGRVARLELAAPTGLLTLHPDPNGSTLHGNVVAAHGVRHLAFRWGPAGAIAVQGQPIADAVTAHRLSSEVGVAADRAVAAVVIGPDLSIQEADVRFERRSVTTWRIVDPLGERTLDIDPRGVPTGWADADEWPLELD